MTKPEALAEARRAVAPLSGIVLALIGTAAIVRAPLGRLADARTHHAQMEALVASPLPPPAQLLSKSQTIRAEDGPAGARALEEVLRKKALAAGLLVETMTPAADAPALARVRFAVSGSEKAVLAFIGAVEGGTPTVRLPSWRLAPAEGGTAVRFQAEALAIGSRS